MKSFELHRKYNPTRRSPLDIHLKQAASRQPAPLGRPPPAQPCPDQKPPAYPFTGRLSPASPHPGPPSSGKSSILSGLVAVCPSLSEPAAGGRPPPLRLCLGRPHLSELAAAYSTSSEPAAAGSIVSGSALVCSPGPVAVYFEVMLGHTFGD